MKKFLAVVLGCVWWVSGLWAGDIDFKGLAHLWLSYTNQSVEDSHIYGFTIKRLRLIPSGSFSEKIKWGFQVGWDEQQARLLDVYLDFRLGDTFNVKAGQFPAPGAISGSLTSPAELDFIERAAVTEKWSDNSKLENYRALGVQAYGTLMEGKLSYAFMIANPRTLELFSPSIKDFEYEHQHNGLSIWGRLEVYPMKGLNFGGFFGTGNEEETDIERYSYGAHLFFVGRSLNLKLEYIAGQFGFEDKPVKYDGVYAVLGYRFKKIECLLRYGFYTPNDGKPNRLGIEKFTNMTLGINYFCTDNVKIQANYVIRQESMAEGLEGGKNNILYINCQFSF